jgi:DNA-binding transcriptional LysR family regulator
MPVNFDFNDLYAFRALMEYGSFRLAAESICLSQSALSRRIEKLETALGNRLFERTTRRVTLTLYGQNFAERSEQLLAHVETVLADISQVSKARTGLVTVATVPSAAYYFMPDIIRSFQARYPQVRIRLIDSSVGNVIEAVSSGQADFGSALPKTCRPASNSPRWPTTAMSPPVGMTIRWQAGRTSAGRHILNRIILASIGSPATGRCSTGSWRI